MKIRFEIKFQEDNFSQEISLFCSSSEFWSLVRERNRAVVKFQQIQGNSVGWYHFSSVLKDKEKAASMQWRAEVRK